jgi:uncharacterized membrane protein (UPF0182 family)
VSKARGKQQQRFRGYFHFASARNERYEYKTQHSSELIGKVRPLPYQKESDAYPDKGVRNHRPGIF